MDPRASITDIDLEVALFDLAGALAPTPAPDLAVAIRSRVEALGVPAPGLRRRLDDLVARPTRPLRRGLILALAALVLLAGLAAAIGFGLPGLRIEFLGPGFTSTPASSPTSSATGAPASGPGASPSETTPPTPTPMPTAAPIDTLGLGDVVDPSAVDAAAGRHVLLPTLSTLGRPLGVYVRGTPPSTLVTAAYAASAAMPAPTGAPVAGGLPVAILVMELPGSTDVIYLQKVLPPGTTIEPVTVDGHPGFWIAGQPHELLYVTPNGTIVSEPARLASNVLVWNDGALTIRIEGAADLATARGIAASLR
jgi:hypothetical protein